MLRDGGPQMRKSLHTRGSPPYHFGCFLHIVKTVLGFNEAILLTLLAYLLLPHLLFGQFWQVGRVDTRGGGGRLLWILNYLTIILGYKVVE